MSDLAPAPWYRDRPARRFILGSYLPWLATLSLGWEIAQVPLYTLWSEASAAYIAFAVAHCTVGDALIGAAAVMLALITTRARALATWRWVRVAVLATAIGIGYTFVSEWMNTSLIRSWQYSALMPILEVRGAVIGLSPLAQWLLLPPLALCLARFTAGGAQQ